MAIDIGVAAIDRGAFRSAGKTVINEENPANANGTINSVEIWARSGNDLANCIVGTFYKTNGNTLKCRDSEVIGAVTSGSKQTFPVTIDVQASDYIGIYFTGGRLEADNDGCNGLWETVGEYIDPGDEATYSHNADDAISLYGTGEEVGGETHYGEATLSGVGTLSAIGSRILTGTVTLSGTGSLSAIGQRIVTGVAILTGTGSLVAKGVGIFTGKVTLSGAGALSAFGRIVGEGLRILSLIDGGLKRGLDLSDGGFFRGGLSLSEGGLKRGLCLKEGGFKGG